MEAHSAVPIHQEDRGATMSRRSGSKRVSPSNNSSSKKKSRRSRLDEEEDKEAVLTDTEPEASSDEAGSNADDNDSDHNDEAVESEMGELNDDIVAEEEPDDEEPVEEEFDEQGNIVPRSLDEALHRNRKNGGKRCPEAGIIKRISCENFMCHRKLTVDFCQNVNFISGQNGSGKSAILAAIRICLGASARRTGRAGNLRDYILRDGSSTPDYALVRVTLLNKGSDAYKPKKYGDEVTIERRIAASGGYNGYKLLDVEGKSRSTSKSDLVDLLDTLNIQVDNPVAVLDQEEAKQFLTGKDQDKYDFFLKATELGRVSRKLCETEEEIERQNEIYERQREIIQPKVDRCQALKQKWQEAQEVEKLNFKVIKLTAQYGWATYEAATERYEQEASKLEAFKEKAKKKQEALARDEAAAANPDDETQAKQDRITQLLQEAEEVGTLKEEVRVKLKDAKRPLAEVDRKLCKLTEAKRRAKKEVYTAQKTLKGERDKIMEKENSAESEEARRLEKLGTAETRLGECRGKSNELRESQGKWLREYEELDPHVQEARSSVSSMKRQLEAISNKIHSLESSSGGNNLAMYGPRVSKVVSLIDKYRRDGAFQGEIIGPVGSFLKVAPGKEEFAAVAEHALGGGILDRFIVTNNRDGKLMRTIRQKAGCGHDCGIFSVKPSARYRIPEPPGIDGIETVATVFTIENDVVFNALVDNAKIEKKAVARSNDLSERELLTQRNGVSAIRGSIATVYCLPHGDNWTVNGGAYAMFSNQRKIRSTIGVDRSAALAEAFNDEKRIREELHDARKSEAKLDHDHTHAQKQWNVAKRASRENDEMIYKLETEIAQMKEEQENAAATTVDLSEFEADVQKAEEGLEDINRQVGDLDSERERLAPKVQNLTGQIDEYHLRSQKIASQIQKAEDDLTQCMQTMTQTKNKVEKARRKLAEYQQIIDDHKRHVGEMERMRDEDLEKARGLHSRYEFYQKLEKIKGDGGEHTEDVKYEEPTAEELAKIDPQSVDHEPAYFQARIVKTQSRIEAEKRKGNRQSEGDAYDRYKKAEADIKESYDKMKQTKIITDGLRSDVALRKSDWKMFRGHLSKLTSLQFGELLTLNKQSGTVTFDHKNRTLQLHVRKNGAKKSGDVKSLSGGEKSFTTMCLLLALGEQLETPFRILDEFDVFLDSQVRKLTIESLIHVAKVKMPHRQFIFITPQDLSNVTPDDQLRILRMNPPERHDRAGGATQQTLGFSQSGG